MRDLVYAVVWLLLAPSMGTAQAKLILRDSLQLEQTGDSYLTLPSGVFEDDGAYLVVDAQNPQVFRFDSAGALVQEYGREGEGPGEFKEVTAALPLNSDEIVIFSWLPPAAQVFNRQSGEFVARFPLEPPLESVLLSGNGVWLSGVSYSAGTSVRKVTLGGTLELAIPLVPDEYSEGGPLGGIFHKVPFATWADTVLVGFEPLDKLFVATTDAVEETLRIPAVRRRGTPENPGSALTEALRQGPYFEVFGVLSALRGMHRRSDGSVILVYLDHRPNGPPVTSEVFVTILDATRKRACVDTPISLGPESQPAIGFAGDHLLVLDQVVVGLEAVPILRRFEIDATGCDWIDVHG